MIERRRYILEVLDSVGVDDDLAESADGDEVDLREEVEGLERGGLGRSDSALSKGPQATQHAEQRSLGKRMR